MQRLLTAISMILLCYFPCYAAQIQWDGTGRNTYWTNTANWTTHRLPTAYDIAHFGNMGNQATVNANSYVAGLSFDRANDFTINSRGNNALYIGDNGITVNAPDKKITISTIILTNDQMWSVNSGTLITNNLNTNFYDLSLDGRFSFSSISGYGNITQQNGIVNFLGNSNYWGTYIQNNGTTNLETNRGLGRMMDTVINGGVFNLNSTTDGFITLNNGVLNVNGTFNGILWANDGLLSGNGRITTPVDLYGAISGNLTIDDLTFEDNSKYIWHFNGEHASDIITIRNYLDIKNARLMLDFGDDVDFQTSYWDIQRQWNIIDGDWTNGTFLYIDSNKLYAPFGDFSVIKNSNGIFLQWIPLPEPSLLALLMFGAIIVIWQKKKKL